MLNLAARTASLLLERSEGVSSKQEGSAAQGKPVLGTRRGLHALESARTGASMALASTELTFLLGKVHVQYFL